MIATSYDRTDRSDRSDRSSLRHDRGRRAPVRAAAGRSFGKWVAIIGVTALAAVAGAPQLSRLFHRLQPFSERTVDRTQPAILQALTDLHDYRAASATFDITVDVEKDARWMPAALRGEHKVMSARGSVDAGVDLAGLDASAIVVDPATKAITVTLPHARLRSPTLDLAATKLVVHQRGLLDRIGSAVGGAPSGEQPMLQLAQTKLAAAARASDVTTRAEENTRQMITALVHGLGKETALVTVNFANPPRPRDPNFG